MNPTSEKSIVLATGSSEAAERDSLRAGFDPVLVVSKAECKGDWAGIRRFAREQGVRTMLIHSREWAREPTPQLYELAALRLGLPNCHILERGGEIKNSASRCRLATQTAVIPVEAASGLALVGAEAMRLRRLKRVARERTTNSFRADGPLLALWIVTDPQPQTGGSVTHMSGVLAAFRRAGLRVILVGLQQPPAQISRAIDEFVCIRPLSRRARVTHEITSVAANRVARQVAETVCKGLDPGLIYQRYDTFLTCGVEVGRCVGVPVVVEWNASVVWTRNNWHERGAFWHLMTPLLEQAEGYVAAEADLVAAVSTQAARMAVDAGAPPQRVMTVPNAVDVDDIDAGLVLAASSPKDCLVGWVGSFGLWHGAEVLVQAMSLLPERVRAVMIGDGNNRAAAERLARTLGVWERIDWTGELPHAEAIRRLSECEVLVSPHVPLEGGQRFFGSPTKLFEYMAIGRPIVASALDQLAEVLTADETARLVPPGDPNELARGILWMIENPTHARRLATAARAEAMSRHTWDHRVRAILKRLSGTVQ